MSKNGCLHLTDSTQSTSAGSWLLGLFLGALGGITLGLLTAPKSGNQLRDELTNQAKQLPERISELVDDTLDLYASGVNYAQLAVEEQTMRVKRAVAAGRLAAAKKREELDYSNSSALPFQHH